MDTLKEWHDHLQTLSIPTDGTPGQIRVLKKIKAVLHQALDLKSRYFLATVGGVPVKKAERLTKAVRIASAIEMESGATWDCAFAAAKARVKPRPRRSKTFNLISG